MAIIRGVIYLVLSATPGLYYVLFNAKGRNFHAKVYTMFASSNKANPKINRHNKATSYICCCGNIATLFGCSARHSTISKTNPCKCSKCNNIISVEVYEGININVDIMQAFRAGCSRASLVC